jgi:hypothetical protein
VAELTVQLDEDALLHVGDVVPLCASGSTRVLTGTPGQSVGSLDVTEVTHLHGALRAAGDVAEHLLQQRRRG